MDNTKVHQPTAARLLTAQTGCLQPSLFDERPAPIAADPIGTRDDSSNRRAYRSTLCAQLAAFLSEQAGEWIDGRELATIAGSYGWRTRVSDLRFPPYNLVIENRQRRESGYVVSEYRLVEGEDDAA